MIDASRRFVFAFRRCSRSLFSCLSKIPGRVIFLLLVCKLVNAQEPSARSATPREFFLAFCCVVIVGVVANAVLVDLVRPRAILSKWQKTLEFSPATLGGFSWRNLALWSVLSLFMELLMIRWISSEIRIFAYFKNFVLIGCFLGFGLGCYLSRRKINLLLMLFPLIVLTLFVHVQWVGLRAMISQLPAFVGASTGTQVWGIPSAPTIPMLVAATAVIVPIFGLITFFFVPMGQLVGWYLENSTNGTLAYSINVFAALCGIIAYTVLCFFSQPPAVWILSGGMLLVLLVWTAPALRWAALVSVVVCADFLEMRPSNGETTYWSPYQKLTLGINKIDGEVLSYYLNTNDSCIRRY